jgi:hypothetical protein
MHRLCELAAHVHAAHAELAGLAVTAKGKPIADPDAPPVVTTPGTADLRTLLHSTEPITASSAYAPDAGMRLDLGYITGVLSDACAARLESSSHAPPDAVTRT